MLLHVHKHAHEETDVAEAVETLDLVLLQIVVTVNVLRQVAVCSFAKVHDALAVEMHVTVILIALAAAVAVAVEAQQLLAVNQMWVGT
jgi:hypothetical protein